MPGRRLRPCWVARGVLRVHGRGRRGVRCGGECRDEHRGPHTADPGLRRRRRAGAAGRARRTTSSRTRTSPSSTRGDVGDDRRGARGPSSRCSPSSAARTSASRPWSTASSAAARPSSRTSPASPATASRYPAEWAGTRFTLVDTGGWEVDVAGIEARVAAAGRDRRSTLADAVIFVVDATVGATDDRRARCVRLLRKAGKPVVLVRQQGRRPARRGRRRRPVVASAWASRTPSPRCTAAAPATCSTPRSTRCPRSPRTAAPRAPAGPRRVALVGRPNVGKSSLLNKVLGAERVVVDSVAGTTRDPVDELVELGGKPWWFVDTAGIRRRVHQTSGADFYASLRTQAAHREGRGRRRAGRRLGKSSPSRTPA